MRDRQAVDSNIRRKEDDDGDDRQNAGKKKNSIQAQVFCRSILVYLKK
jgi:hypothetical protein